MLHYIELFKKVLSFVPLPNLFCFMFKIHLHLVTYKVDWEVMHTCLYLQKWVRSNREVTLTLLHAQRSSQVRAVKLNQLEGSPPRMNNLIAMAVNKSKTQARYGEGYSLWYKKKQMKEDVCCSLLSAVFSVCIFGTVVKYSKRIPTNSID